MVVVTRTARDGRAYTFDTITGETHYLDAYPRLQTGTKTVKTTENQDNRSLLEKSIDAQNAIKQLGVDLKLAQERRRLKKLELAEENESCTIKKVTDLQSKIIGTGGVPQGWSPDIRDEKFKNQPLPLQKIQNFVFNVQRRNMNLTRT